MQLGKSRSRYYSWQDRFLRKRYFCTWCGTFFSNWLFFSVFGSGVNGGLYRVVSASNVVYAFHWGYVGAILH